jgi:iron complex outermembrane recepter protein
MGKYALTCAASAGVLAIMLAGAPAFAQAADPVPAATQDSPAADSQDEAVTEDEIVVTGFRGSLNKAVELKRESISFRDSIVAEDIGKFPEANVADSLQRIPGVILSRDGASNEGQRISIRGLGSDFTVTTINGAPVRTTSAQNVGSSSRDFNYDVFPSELFGRVDVYKSPLANLEEGGIGGVIDLQTPRPFDNNGRVIRYTAQANYNTQSKEWRPRGSLLLSDTWGNFGALFGVAYAKNVNQRSGFQSTGGGTSGYNSSALGRRPYYATPANPVLPNTSGPFNFELNLDSPLANLSGLTRSQVENGYLPRFYRIYASNTERERLGFVGSLQYKSDRFEASIDGIFSELTDQTDEFTFGVPVRNSRTVAGTTSAPGTGTNSGLIPLEVHLDEFNNLYGTFGNSSILTESFYRDTKTRFKYGIVRAAYAVTDTMKLSAQANLSESKAVYSENRIVSNIFGITTTFDPTGNVTYPTISSPYFTNTANYRSPSLGFAINDELDKEKTARAVLDWTPIDSGDQLLSLKLGGSYVSTTKRVQRQDGSSIANTRPLPQGGTFATNPTGVFANMDPFVQFGELSNGGNSGYPSQFATFSRDFVMNVLDANAANRAATPALNQAFSAEEIVKSAFFETSFKIPVAGHPLRVNWGLRFSDTGTLIDNYQTGPGGVGFVPASREGGYQNFLPSANLTFDITPKFVLRASAGQTITRGSLATIAAGTRVPNIFNPAVTVGNPDLRPQLATTYDAALEWYFAPGGLLSAGVFQKNVVDRPFSVVERVPFGTLGIPSNLFNCASLGAGACPPALGGSTIDPNFLFDRTITVNQSKLRLRGLELAYQQNFTFLPEPFDGLGVTSSFTLIDQQGDDFVLRNGDRISMQGVPDYAYSVTAFYEKGPLSIRGSYNYRAKTGQNSTNTGNDQVPYLAPQGFLDGTISYKLNDLFELRIDALNITNENVYFYYENPTQPEGNGQSRRDNSYFNGTTISFGIRGRF